MVHGPARSGAARREAMRVHSSERPAGLLSVAKGKILGAGADSTMDARSRARSADSMARAVSTGRWLRLPLLPRHVRRKRRLCAADHDRVPPAYAQIP